MPDAPHPSPPLADPGHRLDVDLPSRPHQPSDFYLLRRLQMIGPDHYREAERTMSLARCATAEQANGTEPNEAITMMLAAAQVHATLALAAATALTGAMAAESYVDEPELKAWHDVAGVKPEPDAEPAAPVRIDSLVSRVVDGEMVTVLHPHWYDGNPVTIVSLRLTAGDYVSVVFQLPGTDDRAAVSVPADFMVTPVGGAS